MSDPRPRWSVILAAGLTLGCGGAWTVVESHGSTADLRDAERVTVRWDDSALRVDGVPRGELAATGDAREASEVEAALREMRRIYLGELSEHLPVPIAVASGSVGEDRVGLVVRPVELEPGTRGVSGSSTVLVTRLAWSRGDTPIEEIEVRRELRPSHAHPRRRQRMRFLAAQTAEATAAYYRAANR